MKFHRPIQALLIVILLALAACSLAQPTDTRYNDWLSSAVPATLTAMAQNPVVAPTGTPLPTPTETATPVLSSLSVVYSQDGSIWIWMEGGQPKRLSTGTVDERPRVSDDGKLVVFKRGNELWTVNADGTNLHGVIRETYLRGSLPSGSTQIQPDAYAWAPNSHTFFFTTAADTPTPDGVGFYDMLNLFRVDVDANDFGKVFEKGYGGIPYFSPDGKTMALAQGHLILLANTDGSNLHQGMAFDPFGYPDGGEIIPTLVPLPDSSGFRVIIPAWEYLGDPSGKAKLWNIPVQGKPSMISTSPESWPIAGALSPNGNAFVYAVFSTNGNDISQKDCLHRQGGGPEICLDQAPACSFVNWLPDSQRYICADQKPLSDRIYYLGNIDSNNRSQIVGGDSLTWVDDNHYLYITKDNALYLAALDGTQTEVSKGIPAGINYSDSCDIRWWVPFDFSYNH